jgi:hypothetical protein
LDEREQHHVVPLIPSAQLEVPVVRARSGLGSIVLVVWLLIGVLAAAQRHYFSGTPKTCAKAGTTVVTILAGPLNYLGVNPKISCPKPSG